MRNTFLESMTCAALLGASSPALALEKHSRAMDDTRESEWATSCSVTIRYYNNCTGWLWVWNQWQPGEEIGVCGKAPFQWSGLAATWTLTFTPQPSGYGFTGTISVESGCCSGPTLASQPWLPISGFTPHAWNANVPQNFLVRITWAAPPGYTNGSAIATDHPTAGPTGPQACGTCYPANRIVRSRLFGVGGVYCPGTMLNDYVCDVEFVMDFGMKLCVGTDPVSWGEVKNLYR
ncbi:MAG: hypothetical protein ACT4PE_03430 [Candidatus Eiseniibacteriota bacterium]